MISFLKNRNVLLVFGLSAFAGIISKEILILNEETLVAICFVLFVIFAYMNVSDIVVSELKDRASKIQKEFDDYYQLRENILHSLISYHNKQVSLLKEIHQIFIFSKSEIQNIIHAQQKNLQNNISLQIKQKLRILAMREFNFIQFMQTETTHFVTASVIQGFHIDKKSHSKNLLMKRSFKEGIQTLHQMSKLPLSTATAQLLDNALLLHKASGIPMELLLCAKTIK